ncbi:MAG: insulinase family protein [Candidatus Tectomicrobia bacterium]|uniref:Insulinase family protein n=1 Tax=Tectimicrobiota bacterium TaxID=2528274 RepID=A0A932FWS3_UNCTE|nr:insulinase family protein [Candidatus Tectomicrobia bacterium]
MRVRFESFHRAVARLGCKALMILLGLLVIHFVPMIPKGGIGSAAGVEFPAARISGEGGITILKYQLKNGLTVVLQENHATPVVAFNMWVKAGSANETEKEAGISHVFEHMLFKGTNKRPVGMIAQEVEAAGGIINAFTSFDHTVYYLILASRFFETGLDILADAIQNSSFEREELEKEKEVVLEEWRRSQDIPSNMLSDRLFSTSYQRHPYRRPVIGYQETIVGLTREPMLDYFHRWYVPNNMVLVIVGDFQAQEVMPKIEQAFQDFQRQPDPHHERPAEPPQEELKSVLLTKNINQAYMSLAFHIPDIKNVDLYPIDVLALILGQGESSRLYHRVKTEKQSVHTLYASAYTPKDPGLLIIGAALEAKKAGQALEDILQEVYRLRTEEVSPQELEKAKINLESDFVYQRETVQGQARTLGFFETVTGDAGFQQEYLKQIAQVTAADIQRVANLYLKNANLTVGLLLPEGSAPGIESAEIQQIAEAASKGMEAPKRSPQPASKAKAPAPSRPVKRVVLENGITLLIKENPAAPIAAISAVFLGGVRFETRENNGIGNFMASMLTKGTQTRTALEIATEVESMASSLDSFSGMNSFGVAAKFLKRSFAKGLELIADILTHPSFDEGELEKKRADILAAIKRQEDDLALSVFNLFANTLYPRHPYGMNALGTEENVRRLTRQDLLDFYRRYAVAENLVLAVVGDIDADKVIDKIARIFRSFPRAPFKPPEIPPELPSAEVRIKEVNKAKNQAHLVLGFLGTTLDSPDRYPLEVLNAILSGQGGRLFLELRDRQSLAYSVSSFSREGLDPGSLGVYMGTSPDKVEKALAGIQEELRKAITEPVSLEELERAKRYLVGTYEIGLQSNSSQASDMAFNERYGLGHDFHQRYPQKVFRVTAEDVLRVARKYIQPGKYTMAVIRPKEDKEQPKAEVEELLEELTQPVGGGELLKEKAES